MIPGFHAVEFTLFHAGEKAPIIPMGEPMPPEAGAPMQAPAPSMAFWFRVVNLSSANVKVCKEESDIPSCPIAPGKSSLFPAISNFPYDIKEWFVVGEVDNAVVRVEFCHA